MKSKNVKYIISEIIRLDQEGDAWLETINSQVRDSFYDNGYTNILYKQREMLLKFIFKNLYEEVYWFVYDWREGFTITNKDGKDYIINNLDDFIQYLSEEGLVT